MIATLLRRDKPHGSLVTWLRNSFPPGLRPNGPSKAALFPGCDLPVELPFEQYRTGCVLHYLRKVL